MMSHLPKNPFCPHCQRAKMENVRLHRRGGADAHECTKFGDIITVDTMVLHGLKDRGVNGETDAVVFYDLAILAALYRNGRSFSQVYGSRTQDWSIILGPS